MYEVEPKHLYGNPYDNQTDEPKKVKIYGCINPKCLFEMSEEEYYSQREFENFMSKAVIVNAGEEYDFFISYYSGTGRTFAEFLKGHAFDIGQRTAFLDKEDIPKKITADMPEWRSYIDQAIKSSKNFILIMTRRFNERPEVIREYRNALDAKMPIYLFKQEDLDSNDLCSDVGGEPIDFSNIDYTEFKDECDLLSKVDKALSGKIKFKRAFSFRDEANRLIASQALEIKQTNLPLLEMVIGPSDTNQEWLPTSDLINRELLSISPYSNNCCDMKARRNFF
jgi:hypothetical protein